MIKRYKRGTPNPGVSPEDMTSEMGPKGRVWAGLAKGGGKTIQSVEQHGRRLRGYREPGMVGNL